MNCLFERDGEKNGRPVCRCVREGCRRAVYSDDPDSCHAECKAERGWGDLLADALEERLRLTKQRYRKAKVRWGLADACGCAARQEKLNRIGRRIAALRTALALRPPR